MSEVIYIKSDAEIDAMRAAGRITAGARSIARQAIRDGISTKEIDREVRAFILNSGAKPTFYRYGGFPGNLCISVNEEVIHGIPGARRIHTGDIVSVDVGAFFGGFTGDCAGTYPVGEVSEEARRLMEVTRQSFSKPSRWSGKETASRTSGRPCRNTAKAAASEWCATMWDTASDAGSTRRRKFRTTSPTAGNGVRTRA